MFSNKKGGIHVDWIISAGIFLVYILSLFIFIRPGERPEYDANVLLSIVEEGLKDEIYSNVSLTPVFVKGANRKYEVDFPLEGSPGNYNMSTNDGMAVAFSLGVRLRFRAYEDLYWLLYSKGVEFIHEPGEDCIVGVGGSDCLEDGLVFGITELLVGVDVDEVDMLFSSDYDILKQDWGFPENKEFSFYVVEGVAYDYSEDEIIKRYQPVEPFQQAQVFVKEWKDWKLDKTTGEREGVIINVKVW